MMYRLREELGLDVRGFEAAGGVGGTWYWNRYPGARTDSPYSAYCFSWSDEIAQEWSWSERYPGQQEVLRYLEFVADRYDLRRSFTFDTRVTWARHDEDTNLWTVGTDTGETVTATYLITGVGLLSAPNLPPIKGLDTFQGELVHTARWPAAGVDFAGKRVGLVGTGSTGIQILPSIAERASSVSVFQRTPNYVVPTQNRPLTDAEKTDLRARYKDIAKQIRQHPFAMPFIATGQNALDVDEATRQAVYEEGWRQGGFHFLFETFDDLSVNEDANETACEFIRGKIRAAVRDPEVAELLTPRGYPYGAKRPPAGTGYYETFNRDNVMLIDVSDDAIEEITPTGLRTATRQFDLDVIIFATGFDASTGAFTRIDIRGRGGRALADKWRDGPVTNLGFSTAGFPNLFMITGPLSPFANIPTCIEETVDWIFDALCYLRENGLTSFEAAESGEQEWAEHVTAIANMITAGKGEAVNTWFAGANIEGKPRAINVYFGGANAYFDTCRAVAAKAYEGFVLS
jgi:cyclohexanone monooxygenase